MDITKEEVTIGGDPEFFGINNDGYIVASQDIIKGEYGAKERPLQLDGGSIHRDNVLMEITFDAAKTADQLVKNISSVMYQVECMLDTFSVKPLFVPSMYMEDEQLMHFEAQTFGCSPDWDAYLGAINPAPDAMGAGNFRSAGGHVHAGFNFRDVGDQFLAGVSADVFVGLPSVLLDTDGIERKQRLYGKSGAMRPKPYGIEYRTPSNFWMQSEEMMRWMFNHMQAAIRYREEIIPFMRDYQDQVRSAIDTGNQEQAKGLLNIFDVERYIA